ncbi:hypothetical protein SUGI_0680390 [Cryptomeria japonica]|nr:hypothetical protein SUGI_0680390 [Cryptomeria japonica]
MSATVYPPSMWTDEAIHSFTDDQPLEDHKQMEALIEEIKIMFQAMENGKISPSAYDTAWIARIPSIDNPYQPQFPQTLKWIVLNQLTDGSWGGDSCYLPHDRLLVTLSCVIALRIWKVEGTKVQKDFGILGASEGEDMIPLQMSMIQLWALESSDCMAMMYHQKF